MKKRWKCTICGQIFEGEFPPVPCPVCGAGEDAFVLLEDESEVSFRRDTQENFVIIGGGAAALEAAKAIRARNRTGRIQMIAGEGVIPYNRPALTDVLADGYSFEAIALEPFDFYARQRIEFIAAEAQSADATQVTLADGRTLPYDKLLLATGANPFNPIERSEASISCFALRGFVDCMAIEKACRNRRVIVVGGGILGLEAALALREIGAKVTVVELAGRILPLQADDAASMRIRVAMEQKGIEIITGQSVKRLTETGAFLTDERQIEADCALVSIGVRSEVPLAKALGLSVNRGITVDAHMRTDRANVFAAGDCAEFQGRVMGLWAAAVLQGRIAGAAMAGDVSAEYRQIVPATAFEAGSLSMFSAGQLVGEAQLTYEDGRSGAYRRLYFSEGKLVGVMFVGDVKSSGRALGMIEAGAKPEEAKALLV